MDGIHIGDFRSADHGWNVQITLRELRRTNADRLVRKTDGKRVAVGLAVNGDRANAQFLAGANHPQRDFASIGYQDLLEHFYVWWGHERPRPCKRQITFLLLSRTNPGRTRWAGRFSRDTSPLRRRRRPRFRSSASCLRPCTTPVRPRSSRRVSRPVANPRMLIRSMCRPSATLPFATPQPFRPGQPGQPPRLELRPLPPPSAPA